MTEGQGEQWLDGIISNLISAKNTKAGTPVSLSANDCIQLCDQARNILLGQPMLLELGAPIKICGDIHGQFNDLLRLFEYGGFPPEVSYILCVTSQAQNPKNMAITTFTVGNQPPAHSCYRIAMANILLMVILVKLSLPRRLCG